MYQFVGFHLSNIDLNWMFIFQFLLIWPDVESYIAVFEARETEQPPTNPPGTPDALCTLYSYSIRYIRYARYARYTDS